MSDPQEQAQAETKEQEQAQAQPQLAVVYLPYALVVPPPSLSNVNNTNSNSNSNSKHINNIQQQQSQTAVSNLPLQILLPTSASLESNHHNNDIQKSILWTLQWQSPPTFHSKCILSPATSNMSVEAWLHQCLCHGALPETALLSLLQKRLKGRALLMIDNTTTCTASSHAASHYTMLQHAMDCATERGILLDDNNDNNNNDNNKTAAAGLVEISLGPTKSVYLKLSIAITTTTTTPMAESPPKQMPTKNKNKNKNKNKKNLTTPLSRERHEIVGYSLLSSSSATTTTTTTTTATATTKATSRPPSIRLELRSKQDASIFCPHESLYDLISNHNYHEADDEDNDNDKDNSKTTTITTTATATTGNTALLQIAFGGFGSHQDRYYHDQNNFESYQYQYQPPHCHQDPIRVPAVTAQRPPRDNNPSIDEDSDDESESSTSDSDSDDDSDSDNDDDDSDDESDEENQPDTTEKVVAATHKKKQTSPQSKPSKKRPRETSNKSDDDKDNKDKENTGTTKPNQESVTPSKQPATKKQRLLEATVTTSIPQAKQSPTNKAESSKKTTKKTASTINADTATATAIASHATADLAPNKSSTQDKATGDEESSEVGDDAMEIEQSGGGDDESVDDDSNDDEAPAEAAMDESDEQQASTAKALGEQKEDRNEDGGRADPFEFDPEDEDRTSPPQRIKRVSLPESPPPTPVGVKDNSVPPKASNKKVLSFDATTQDKESKDANEEEAGDEMSLSDSSVSSSENSSTSSSSSSSSSSSDSGNSDSDSEDEDEELDTKGTKISIPVYPKQSPTKSSQAKGVDLSQAATADTVPPNSVSIPKVVHSKSHKRQVEEPEHTEDSTKKVSTTIQHNDSKSASRNTIHGSQDPDEDDQSVASSSSSSSDSSSSSSSSSDSDSASASSSSSSSSSSDDSDSSSSSEEEEQEDPASRLKNQNGHKSPAPFERGSSAKQMAVSSTGRKQHRPLLDPSRKNHHFAHQSSFVLRIDNDSSLF